MTSTEPAPASRRSGAARHGDPNRVTEIHHQARRSLVAAAAFTMAAPLAVLVPHATGEWLPLHLFLVGGLLNAVSGATQLLAVTWSASPAPSRRAASVQRSVLTAGAIAVAFGRELDNQTLAAAGGAAVTTALALLGANLVRIRRTAVTERFLPAIDGYLLAVTVGVLGTLLAVALVTGHAGTRWDDARAAHLTINLYGLVGIVIAATLPYFAATQARTKMSARATPRRLRRVTVGLAIATGVAATGHLLGRPAIAAAGLAAYAVGIVATLFLLPSLRRRHLDWAGPRLVQLGAGIVWWAATTLILAFSVLAERPDPTPILLAMIIGGFAQILLASVAYFAPVLRGGGHEHLSAGLAITRSWPALAAANIAAVGALAELSTLLAVGLAAWIVDTIVRAARFAAQNSQHRP